MFSGRILKNKVAGFFYPAKCEGCGLHLTEPGKYYCPSCEKRLAGKPACYILKGKNFEVAVAPFQFGDPVAQTLMRYKEFGGNFYTSVYAKHMKEAMDRYGYDFDLVTWVPMYTLTRMWRGFDHSKLVAEKLGKLYRTCTKGLLVKTRHTAPQRGMSLRSRQTNVIGAYRVRKGKEALIRGRKILLVDDVLTTGATMETVARELMYAGAASVVCVTVATGKFAKTL